MPDRQADLRTEHSFAAPLERVTAMYSNVDFARERALSTGVIECDAMVDGDASTAFNVVIRRVVSTEGIQPEFRPFIGSSITVRYSEAWEPPSGDTREGTFAIEIVGVPARAAGSFHLASRGDITTFSIQGTVTAHVPLLGGLVTQAVVDTVSASLERELTAADEWLSKT